MLYPIHIAESAENHDSAILVIQKYKRLIPRVLTSYKALIWDLKRILDLRGNNFSLQHTLVKTRCYKILRKTQTFSKLLKLFAQFCYSCIISQLNVLTSYKKCYLYQPFEILALILNVQNRLAYFIKYSDAFLNHLHLQLQFMMKCAGS